MSSGKQGKVLQGLLTPDMRELKSSLASIKDELPRMQQRVMQQTTDRMEATEERLLLTFQLAQATARIEGLEDRLRENVSGETP